ncbi:MAG TPA: SIMPL domain-containing protein [Trebonia sp.]|nr:SIMPL domain-containing protein [Trebonia sp.]
MQMIERPWGVTVYSTASVKAAPDLVRLRFRVARLQQTPAQAFAAATEAVGAVRQAIRAHNVPDADVQRSHLSLKSQWSYGNERKFLGYQCQASFSVESRDLDGVQQLLVDIVAAGTNEIEGVDFDVVDKPGLRAEARRAAVAAARRKAELYAEEARVRLGSIVHIEDEDPEQIRGQYRSHSSAGVEASEGDLAPGHVVVSAAVSLGFAIAHD